MTPLVLKRMYICTGISILLMALLAALLMGLFFNEAWSLDAKGLSDLLTHSPNALRWGILGWLGIILADVMVSWCVQNIYKAKKGSIASLSAIFRYLYTAVLIVATISLVLAHFVQGEFNGMFEESVYLLVSAFNVIWSFGLIVFGFHLIVLAYLVYESPKISKVLAILLLLGGIGYVLIHGGQWISSNFKAYEGILENIFMLPMVIGELGWGIYLLIKGFRKTTLPG